MSKLSELSLKTKQAYDRSTKWLVIANERIEKGLDAAEAERKSEYWLIRYNILQEQLNDICADLQECPACKGDKWVSFSSGNLVDGITVGFQQCPDCSGMGKVEATA